jgi:hypothetical protein
MAGLLRRPADSGRGRGARIRVSRPGASRRDQAPVPRRGARRPGPAADRVRPPGPGQVVATAWPGRRGLRRGRPGNSRKPGHPPGGGVGVLGRGALRPGHRRVAARHSRLGVPVRLARSLRPARPGLRGGNGRRFPRGDPHLLRRACPGPGCGTPRPLPPTPAGWRNASRTSPRTTRPPKTTPTSTRTTAPRPSPGCASTGKAGAPPRERRTLPASGRSRTACGTSRTPFGNMSQADGSGLSG